MIATQRALISSQHYLIATKITDSHFAHHALQAFIVASHSVCLLAKGQMQYKFRAAPSSVAASDHGNASRSSVAC